jgi:hypothetical protein
MQDRSKYRISLAFVALGILMVEDIPQGFAQPAATRSAPKVSSDYGVDAYHDLAVGVPWEDYGSTYDENGQINVLYGSYPDIAAENTQYFMQGVNGLGDAMEDDDWFGYSLATLKFRSYEVSLPLVLNNYPPEFPLAGESYPFELSRNKPVGSSARPLRWSKWYISNNSFTAISPSSRWVFVSASSRQRDNPFNLIRVILTDILYPVCFMGRLDNQPDPRLFKKLPDMQVHVYW